MHIFKKALLPLMATAAIVGCSNDNNSIEDVIGSAGSVDTSVPSGPVAIFRPSQSILPAPSDILFSGTLDGSLNIPDQPNSNSLSAPTDAELRTSPRVALNTLDGYSTISPITFGIGVPVDASAIMDGSAVRVFRSDNVLTTSGGTAVAFDSATCLFGGSADPASPACVGYDTSSKSTWSFTGTSEELQFGIDFVTSVINADDGSVTVAILPIKPLAGSSNFIVMVTNDIVTAADATPIRADLEYRLAKQTTPVFYLTRDLATELGAVQIGGIAAALTAPVNVLTDFFTPGSVGALEANDSCVLVKSLTDQIDALNALPAQINLNIETDCAATLNAISEPATANTFESLRIQTSAREQALNEFANVEQDDMVLTYSFSTQNIGTALLQAKGIIAAQVAPASAAGAAITVTQVPMVNPVDSIGIDIDGSGPAPTTSFADMFAGTLNDVPQFLDPADATTAIWQGDAAAWAQSATFGGGPTGDAIAAACVDAFGTTASGNLVQCNGYRPAKATDTTLPLLISVPKLATVNATRALLNGGAPNDCPANLPITIYQHGITGNRASLIIIADNLALQCQVTVAIDIPQHGIVDGDPLFDSLRAQHAGIYPTVAERLVPGSTSGQDFINLANLANSRDTFRQGVADLHSLMTAVAPTAVTNMALPSALGTALGVSVDQTQVSFVGMSLGGILGMSFVANQPGIGAAVLNVTGGGIGKLLDGSNSFEPRITAGLAAAAGITKPSGDYEAFLLAAQTLVDSADPINLVAQIVNPVAAPGVAPAAARPILFQEIAGNATNLPDGVVPNNVFGLPTSEVGIGMQFASIYTPNGAPATYNPVNTTPGFLSGSDPIVRGTAFVSVATALAAGALPPALATPLGINTLDNDADGLVDAAFGPLEGGFLGMNLAQVSEAGGAIPRALVRYSEGDHGSLLNPAASPAVTTAMQLQMSGFIASANAGAPAVLGTASLPPVPAGVIIAP